MKINVKTFHFQCQERSEFYSMVDLSKTPVLYTPQPGSQSAILGKIFHLNEASCCNISPSGLQQPAIAGGGGSPSVGAGAGAASSVVSTGPVSVLKSNHNNSPASTTTSSTQPVSEHKRKVIPNPETRMVVYVRQENEEIYTPLHLVPPTVQGLARAIESKYNVSAAAIRWEAFNNMNYNFLS